MISVKNLVKSYDANKKNLAVDQINFDVPEGNLFTLLGPSGCGKSTTLRMIAGLEEPTDGEIMMGDQLVYSKAKRINVPSNKRPIGMVFQSYAIWPHMSVFENVSFPLKMEKLNKQDIYNSTNNILEIVGLQDYADRSATALSGGQQQRVALARALVREPKVLLLDEPLSNLDAKLREQMRDEIRLIQQRMGITAIYVTHDQSEALAISDLVMLMKSGKIMEFGRPEDIYYNPRTAYGAQFIGVSNQFQGNVTTITGDCVEVAVSQNKTLKCSSTKSWNKDDKVDVFIRPENIVLSRERTDFSSWYGVVSQAVFQGDCWDYTVSVDELRIRIRVNGKNGIYRRDEVVYLSWKPEDCILLSDAN